jgi:hypothetical protein
MPMSRSAYAVIAVVAALIIGAVGLAYFGQLFAPKGGVSYETTETPTSFANSTYTWIVHSSETADYYLDLRLNVTCSGCSFTGEYRASLPTAPVSVSGNGSRAYQADSFDSPLSLSWNISKNSSAGTLTITLEGTNYYESTSAPYGNLSGVWSIAVAYGIG